MQSACTLESAIRRYADLNSALLAARDLADPRLSILITKDESGRLPYALSLSDYDSGILAVYVDEDAPTKLVGQITGKLRG